MSSSIDSPLDEHETQIAKTAQRCIMAALDHSRAPRIALVDADASDDNVTPPTLEIPPQALRLFADILGAMARREIVSLVPQKSLLTTQEAANFLNVSRPFLIKQLNNKKIDYLLVGRHRRIEFRHLIAFRDTMKRASEHALQELADQAQEMGMGY